MTRIDESPDEDSSDQEIDFGDQADGFVQERPLTAVAIAMVCGMLFARALF